MKIINGVILDSQFMPTDLLKLLEEQLQRDPSPRLREDYQEINGVLYRQIGPDWYLFDPDMEIEIPINDPT